MQNYLRFKFHTLQWFNDTFVRHFIANGPVRVSNTARCKIWTSRIDLKYIDRKDTFWFVVWERRSGEKKWRLIGVSRECTSYSWNKTKDAFRDVWFDCDLRFVPTLLNDDHFREKRGWKSDRSLIYLLVFDKIYKKRTLKYRNIFILLRLLSAKI